MQRNHLMILMKDRPGAICRITGMFMRRDYDIRSLNAAPMGEGLGRISMVVWADPYALTQLLGQLEKLEDVLSVQRLREGVRGECALVKLAAGSEVPAGATALYRDAHITVVAVCGDTQTLQAILARADVLEYARSGELVLQETQDTLQGSVQWQNSLFDLNPFPTEIDR